MKIAAFLGLGFAFAILAQAADLEVVIEGVDCVEGNVMIGIYNSDETFRITPMAHSKTVEVVQELVEAKKITAVLEGLEPGTYAIAVVWDLNKNGAVDVAGPFNKPTEPISFSNSPRMFFGPPKYKDCTFVVTEEGGKVEITLIK